MDANTGQAVTSLEEASEITFGDEQKETRT